MCIFTAYDHVLHFLTITFLGFLSSHLSHFVRNTSILPTSLLRHPSSPPCSCQVVPIFLSFSLFPLQPYITFLCSYHYQTNKLFLESTGCGHMGSTHFFEVSVHPGKGLLLSFLSENLLTLSPRIAVTQLSKIKEMPWWM